MNLRELLSKTRISPAYLSQIADLDHQWIARVDDLLSSLQQPQLDILADNFSPVSNVDQMYDKISEIVVASLFIEQQPVFSKDNQGQPDILLSKPGKYIEVKRLNNSDYEKWGLDGLAASKLMTGIRTISQLERQSYPMEKSLFLIKDALEKFIRNNIAEGTIYFLYSLDKLGQIQDWAETEKIFIEKLMQSWNRLPATTIQLQVHNQNELFNR